MKVALYTYAYLRATETFVMRQVDALNADVICRELDGNEADNPKVHAIGDQALVEKVRAHLERKWLRIYQGRYPAYWLSIKETQRLEDKLTELQPDVVLASFGPSFINVAPACARLKIPVVPHFHGYDLSSLLRYPSYRRSLRLQLDHASAAVVVNRTQLARLRELECSCEIYCIPYGYLPKPGKVTSISPAKILAVGRLVGKKDPEGLVQVARHLHQLDYEGEFNIIGDGQHLDRFQDQARSISSETFEVKFYGRKTHDDTLRYFEQATCFLQLSRMAANGDEEGWPNTVAEAMSHGSPVVATRSPGIKDQVQDGVSGTLVDPGDYAGAARAILRYVNDSSLAAKHGAAGYAISQEYTTTDALQKLREVLQTVVQESNRS